MGCLNPSDLMVCDYVFRAGYGIAEVFEVCATSVRVQLVSDGKIMTWSKLIEPIPLTAEILEKNGFKWNELPFVLGWEQFGLTLHLSANGYHITCGQNIALNVDNVHNLQHTLRNCGLKDVANNFNL